MSAIASSSPTLQRLHGDLHAALLAGVPLDIGFRGRSDVLAGRDALAGRSQVARLERWQSQLQQHLTTHTSIEDAVQRAEDTPTAYRAAVLQYSATGTSPPILQALAAGNLAQWRVTRLARTTLFYLAVIYLVAALGLLLFSFVSQPAVINLQQDLQPVVAIRSFSSDLPTASQVVAGVLALTACACLLLTTRPASKLLLAVCGGKRFRDLRVAAAATRAAAGLVAAGVDVPRARKSACDLVSAGPRVQRLVGAAAVDPTGPEAGAASLTHYAAFLDRNATTRLAMLGDLLPTILIVAGGGACLVLYLVLTLGPVLVLYYDLMLPEVW